jgi:hypothetical protein
MKKSELEYYDKGLCAQLHQTITGNYFHYWYKNRCYLIVRLK